VALAGGDELIEHGTQPGVERPSGGRARSRFAELYVQYAPDAMRLAYLLTGDRGLAEDWSRRRS
jgi:hypothetical protein